MPRSPRLPAVRSSDIIVEGYGITGYVALCAHEEPYDAVLMLAIRHQREAGYATPSAD